MRTAGREVTPYLMGGVGMGAIWEGGAPDSTLAEVGSVLGSVGGLSITVGSGGELGRVL